MPRPHHHTITPVFSAAVSQGSEAQNPTEDNLMKKFGSYLLFAAIIMPAPLMADSLLGDANVSYRGDRSAVSLCKAIANDDVQKLDSLLGQIKRSALYGYTFDKKSRAVAGSVTCNGKKLMEYADAIGAQNVSGYFNGGAVTIEELATTTN